MNSGGSRQRMSPQEPGQRARARLAAYCAAAALVALIVGGVAMSLTMAGAGSVEQQLLAGRAHPALHAGAAVALVMVSLADLGTIAALHDHLHPHGHLVVLLAAGTAIVGDVLNIGGRLAQLAIVPVAISGRTDLAPSAVLALDALDTTLNAAGFALVAVAFAAFGVLFLRAGIRLLGLTALVAAVGTAIGQLPQAQSAFYLANVAFLFWYGGLARLFFGRARVAEVAR